MASEASARAAYDVPEFLAAQAAAGGGAGGAATPEEDGAYGDAPTTPDPHQQATLKAARCLQLPQEHLLQLTEALQLILTHVTGMQCLYDRLIAFSGLGQHGNASGAKHPILHGRKWPRG